jgi:hypothetical protein
MQATATSSRESFAELAAFVFDSGEPVVFQAYSACGQPLRRFRTASELISSIESEITQGQRFLLYAIHFPDSLGHVAEQKITLNAKKCGGHTWRYAVEGWGLIQFQADVKHAPMVICRVAVNTQKRAEAWASTFPHLGGPGSWNWQAVEKHARRIIRRMKKVAERNGPANDSQSIRSKMDWRSEDRPTEDDG